MKLFDFFYNLLFCRGKYKYHSECVVVACFFNPTNSPYRLSAFARFYESIKHLNHRIIELTIGDGVSQLPNSPYITKVHSDSLLWHKEALLNKVISELPERFKYVLWVDADVKFMNRNWVREAVTKLQTSNMVQLFEYGIHLAKNHSEPEFDVEREKWGIPKTSYLNKRIWRSFGANCRDRSESAVSTDYHTHGHVGFAWGARREILDLCPLYDKALVGGADHIMAHAAAGHIPHKCITKSFTDDIIAVEAWSRKFHDLVQGKIDYVKGDLYHYWHGDTSNRNYLRRIQDFTKQSKEIREKDKNGLYIKKDDPYMKEYFKNREVPKEDCSMDDLRWLFFEFATLFWLEQYLLEPNDDGCFS